MLAYELTTQPTDTSTAVEDRHNTQDLVFYVIGDRFEQFCDHNVVLNYSEALAHHKIIARLANTIVIGQGVGSEQLLSLQKALAAAGTRRAIRVQEYLSEKVAAALIDKQLDNNVLITRPQHIGPLHFCSQLVVDNHCAELADCLFAEHLPGSLLIEAAKQVFIASMRTYKPAPLQDLHLEDVRFTLSALDVQFEHFVFPIAAELHLTLQNIHIDGLRAEGAAKILITQLERLCCTITFHAQAYNPKVSASLEHRCGIRVKNRLLRGASA